jgi:magnesium transporter
MISLTTIKSKYESFGKQPGYLNSQATTTLTSLEVITYNAEKVERKKNVKLSEVLAQCSDDKVTWLIYRGLPSTKSLQEIGKHLNLDSLVLEDIQNCALLRPGYFINDSSLFASAKFPLMVKDDRYAMTATCFVAAQNIFITFLTSDNNSLNPLIERVVNSQGRICSRGVDYLAFCHLDLAVDYYFMFINNLSSTLEQIEERIISNPDPSMLGELQQLKRISAAMRKSIWPMREMIHAVRGNDCSIMTPDTEKYFMDVDGHMLMIFDNAESTREMISGLLEIYLSSVSNRMNEVMKVLTLIATIFIPLTFVAGIYGMNFEYMPELKWRYGYFIALGVMVAIVLGMLLFFRRKKWL